MVSDAVLRASQDLNKAATRSDASKAPVGLYLACGSQRIGTSKGVGCRSEGCQNLNSNDDDHGLRPKQGGVVGTAF